MSVIIPVFNGAEHLKLSLAHVRAAGFEGLECIVVDDGSTDDSAAVAKEFGCTVLSTGGRKGPAFARNLAAASAQANIILFMDADVCVSTHAFEGVMSAFREDPELDAIIGSYDDTPGAPDLLSQYRNLLHCYVHRNGRRQASTFWTGFGAIRRETFLNAGGFDDSYARPSVEDIELGYRLRNAGAKLALDSSLTVKHLKYWSLAGIIRTDIFDRGIPWAELIVRDRRMPNDLNLRFSQRLSVLLMGLLVPLALWGFPEFGVQLLLTLCLISFLSLSGFFIWSDPAQKKDRLLAIVTLGAGIVVLAFPAGVPWVIPAAAAVYPLMWLRRKVARSGHGVLRGVNVGIGLYLFLTSVIALLSMSHPRVDVIWGILTAVILLNFGFYRFLAHRMGTLESIAAIPFHLLFHLYSGPAMGAGIVTYFLKGRKRLWKTSVPGEGLTAKTRSWENTASGTTQVNEGPSPRRQPSEVETAVAYEMAPAGKR